MRSFVKHVLLITCFYLSAGTAYAAESPNFVFIIADDIGWDDIGCYGNKVVKTPHIDRLSEEGMQFNNAFLTASSCSPSRCSIILGNTRIRTGRPSCIRRFLKVRSPFPCC